MAGSSLCMTMRKRTLFSGAPGTTLGPRVPPFKMGLFGAQIEPRTLNLGAVANGAIRFQNGQYFLFEKPRCFAKPLWAVGGVGDPLRGQQTGYGKETNDEKFARAADQHSF
jgi:hypothetical protein